MEKYLDAAGLKTYTAIVKAQIDKSRQSVLDTKAQPDGIATLDSSGNVPLSQLGNVDNTLYEIVTALPTNLAATATLHNRQNHIFILARSSSEGTSQNAYKEYIYTGTLDTKGNVTDATKWEELGEFTSDVDLKGYSKKTETIASFEIIEASAGTNINAATVRITLADGTQKTVSIPAAAKSGSTYLNGLMLGSDKEKIDKIDTDALLASINNANTAADNANAAAEKANKAADACDSAREQAQSYVDMTQRLADSVGPYTDRASITLSPLQTNAAISADGTLVSKSGWAIAQFTAELGNEYLFKPGETSSDVCVFAEKVDKVETRAIDYAYTYGTDGKVTSATATYNGKTYTYTYAYDDSGQATITDQSGNTVSSLPSVYTTTVGSYQPMTRLNAGAELPEDGYCRFVSNFQAASSITVVVSYKVGSADLTMRVLRDGMTASMCTQLSKINQKVDNVTEVASTLKSQVSALVLQNFCGFSRTNGDASGDAVTTFGSADTLKEVGAEWKLATVKDGKVTHVCAPGRLTLDENGNAVAIDGTDGDVVLINRNCHLIKATKTIEGEELNVIGIGKAASSWYGVASKALPAFGMTPHETVNCQLDGDVRSQAHCVYNKNAKGTNNTPNGIFTASYKTDGGGFSTQYVSAVEAIKQAQNKNTDALTASPYMGWYYETYEALLATMFAELGSLKHTTLDCFGVGCTNTEFNQNNFADEAMSGTSGWNIIKSDGTHNYQGIWGSVYNGTSNVQLLDGICGSVHYQIVEMLEGQRILDGIAKANLTEKIGSSANIFSYDEDGGVVCTSDGSIDFVTGEGMEALKFYYVVRNVPKCQGMADGVMTAVVNRYVKLTLSDGMYLTDKTTDISGCSVVMKASMPIYRGFAIPLVGTFRQMAYAYYTVTNTDGTLTMDYRCCDRMENVPAITDFGTASYQTALGTLPGLISGLALKKDGIPVNANEWWAKKSDYSLSLFCHTTTGGGMRSQENAYVWLYPGNNGGANTLQVHGSVVGCTARHGYASARTACCCYAASHGVDVCAGAFALLLNH